MEPHPECVAAFKSSLLLSGRTIMGVARVQQDTADAEAFHRIQRAVLTSDRDTLKAMLLDDAERLALEDYRRTHALFETA